MGKSLSTAKQINRTPIANVAKESISQQKPNQQYVRKGKYKFNFYFLLFEIEIVIFKHFQFNLYQVNQTQSI